MYTLATCLLSTFKCEMAYYPSTVRPASSPYNFLLGLPILLSVLQDCYLSIQMHLSFTQALIEAGGDHQQYCRKVVRSYSF
jgi:hypothetical protein